MKWIISNLTLITEFTVALGYIIGSALFVVGSVLFLPALFSVWAAPIFLIGSCCFLVSTLAGSLAALLRYIQKQYKICRNEDLHEWLPVADAWDDDNDGNNRKHDEIVYPFGSSVSENNTSNHMHAGVIKNDFSQSTQNEIDIIRVVDCDDGEYS